jgi:hypothetical protein
VSPNNPPTSSGVTRKAATSSSSTVLTASSSVSSNAGKRATEWWQSDVDDFEKSERRRSFQAFEVESRIVKFGEDVDRGFGADAPAK